MEIITVMFKVGEALPQPGTVFNTRKPDAPNGVATIKAVSILGLQWVSKKRRITGITVTLAAEVGIMENPEPKQEGGATQ